MFSFLDIQSAFKTQIINLDLSIFGTGASIDSRSLQPGELFFALKTEKNDGHLYLDQVFEKGASGAVIEKSFYEQHAEKFQASSSTFRNLIVMENPQEFLPKLAIWRRNLAPISVCGITGSVGKTTTKDFLSYFLGLQGSVLATKGNLNNELGLPINLLSLKSSHQSAVLEMGANKKGDIEYLGRIARPDVVIVTSIAPVHLTSFGKLGDIYRAKSEIFSSAKKGGAAVLPSHEYYLIRQAKKQGLRVVTVGEDSFSQYPISEIRQIGISVEFKLKGRIFCVPNATSYWVKNAALAVAAACEMGVAFESIPETWDVHFSKSRIQSHAFADEITVLDDSYNASPLSFSRAVQFFNRFEAKGRKILIISDMLELGSEERFYHERLGMEISKCHFDHIAGYGPRTQYVFDWIRQAKKDQKQCTHYFQDIDSLKQFILDARLPRDTYFLKASRGMALERVLDVFRPGQIQPIASP